MWCTGAHLNRSIQEKTHDIIIVVLSFATVCDSMRLCTQKLAVDDC